jgi:5-methylcytosine-specific restriction endonuclease McrA
MSLAPPRPCSTPGCPALVYGASRCPRHAPKYDDHRRAPSQRGYDVFHRRLRLLCFERDGWRCVDCGFEPELVKLYRKFELGAPDSVKILDELRLRCLAGERHLHADHIKSIAERPDLRLELDNLATRCDQCHNRRTFQQQVHREVLHA